MTNEWIVAVYIDPRSLSLFLSPFTFDPASFALFVAHIFFVASPSLFPRNKAKIFVPRIVVFPPFVSIASRESCYQDF